MNIKKGIILGGGKGSRLYPLTKTLNKHLFPIYNKPMIYYPIANLMESGIRNILLITNPGEEKLFYNLLSEGSHLGLNIQYATQLEPKGLPEAFIIGEDFINSEPVCLNLGDHILFGNSLGGALTRICEKFTNTTLFAIKTDNPSEYGVIEFDKNNNPIKIQEKPLEPKSKYIVTGIYFYSADVVEYSKSLKYSERFELEISDLNNIYLTSNKLKIIKLDSTVRWFDAGNPNRILDISNYIYHLENNKNTFVAYLENIALNKGFITEDQYYKQIDCNKGSQYGEILRKLIN